MGSKMIQKISSFTNNSRNLFEVYESEDGENVIYATFMIAEQSRTQAYQALIDELNFAIKNEEVKNKIIGE